MNPSTIDIPSGLPSVSRAKLPAVYERAKGALDKCSKIDECKDWADKAEALASYAKQAQDDNLRKMADRIQARAIRRCGVLLRQIKGEVGRPTGNGGGAPPNTRSSAARQAGLSRDQKRTALRVARLPDDEFESAVESEDPPTVTALSRRGKLPAPKFDLHGRDPSDFKVATEALGWISDIEKFCSKHQPRQVAKGMLPRELSRRNDVLKKIRAVKRWLERAESWIKKEKEG